MLAVRQVRRLPIPTRESAESPRAAFGRSSRLPACLLGYNLHIVRPFGLPKQNLTPRHPFLACLLRTLRHPVDFWLQADGFRFFEVAKTLQIFEIARDERSTHPCFVFLCLLPWRNNARRRTHRLADDPLSAKRVVYGRHTHPSQHNHHGLSVVQFRRISTPIDY